MNTPKKFLSVLFAWATFTANLPAVQIYWDGNAAVLPHEVNPPWALVTTGNVAAYRYNDGSLPVAYLVSTQAVDNVYFEQSGARIEMTNHLIIQAVVRLASGSTSAANRGPAGITFTTEPNVGGSVWFGSSNLLVTTDGDVLGASTNLNITTNYHTYRIEVQGTTNGSPYTVFYDGAAALTGTLYNLPASFGSSPRIQWGEISGATFGDLRWYSFSHNAGAPFTTLTNPVVELACNSTSAPVVAAVSAPFMNLSSEGRITNGATMFANVSYLFNTDDGIIYRNPGSGFFDPYDTGSRRTFPQSDGSEIMVYEFTDLTFSGSNVRVTGSRAAAILATGDIRLVNGAIIQVEAAGDPGPPGANELSAGLNAPAPLGGGGGRGTPDGYNGGEPPYLVPSTLPTSGPGGGGFVSRGKDGLPAQPVRMWKYNGEPTFDFTLLGTLFRPGGEGGAAYTNFNVLRGGGAGGSSCGEGFAKPGGVMGGHGGGALLLSTPGRITLDSRCSISVDGQTFVNYLSVIAAGGAGGYLVINADQGILNQGSLSARGGTGLKRLVGDPLQITWGSAGDGGGGLIVLKSTMGVTNSGALNFAGGGDDALCTLGALQAQSPHFVNLPPQLLNPILSGGQFSFSFETATNRTYEVQRNDDLNTTNWLTITNIGGTGIPANLLIPAEGAPQRFFRIIAH